MPFQDNATVDCPLPPPIASQKEDDAHESEAKRPSSVVGMGLDHEVPFQVKVSAVTIQAVPVQVRGDSGSPAAIQKEEDTHETEVRAPPGMMVAGLDHEKPFQVRALPLPAVVTAIQKEEDTHETEVRAPPGMMVAGLDQIEPFQVNASLLPLSPSGLPIAIQKDARGQETEWKVMFESTDIGLDHVAPFQVKALPLPSTAMQKEVVGHETALREGPLGNWTLSTATGADHPGPLAVRGAKPKLLPRDVISLEQNDGFGITAISAQRVSRIRLGVIGK
jgi:hypothetical protein